MCDEHIYGRFINSFHSLHLRLISGKFPLVLTRQAVVGYILGVSGVRVCRSEVQLTEFERGTAAAPASRL